MEPEQLSPSVAVTGLGIQYIGSGQYQAASGTVDVDNNETTLLEFVSPYVNLKAYVEYFYMVAASEDMMYRMYLNDIVYLGLTSQSSGINRQPDALILIPRNSNVKLTAQNVENSNSRIQAAVLVAKDVGY
jgi:hypothetical protein